MDQLEEQQEPQGTLRIQGPEKTSQDGHKGPIEEKEEP